MGGKNSSLRIYDSKFIGNKNIYHAGFLSINSIRNKARNYNILFKEIIARAGSVLSVANGDVVFRKCTFLNNFALLQGSQIINAGIGIANLALVDSVFRQTIKKILINNTKLFQATSFVRLSYSGTMAVINTTFDQNTKSNEPLILVTSANFIGFDNVSLSVCPFSHAIQRTLFYKYTVNDNRHRIGLSLSCNEWDYKLLLFAKRNS